jgi:hypothetical protein
MALYFTNVKLLEYTHTPVSLSAGLRYRIEKQFKITGRLLDETYSGPLALFQQQDLLLGGAVDYQDINLNGVSFGAGKVQSISFSGGTMVRTEDYEYSIVCYDEGILTNGSGGVYSGISWTDTDEIEELSESFDYSENEEGDKEYTHSFGVKYAIRTTEAAVIASGKALAASFLSAASGLTQFLNSYAGLSGARRLYSEEYNTVEGSVSITEVLSLPKTAASGYSYSYEYKMDLGEDGFVNASESLSIEGLTNPPYAGARAGQLALESGAATRIASVFSAYNWSDAPLFTSPISKATSIDQFAGTVQITQNFSNNPKYQTNVAWERTIELSRDGDNFYNISEVGSIQGLGKESERLPRAVAFFTNPVLSGIAARIATAYATTGRSETPFQIKQSKSKNSFAGRIEYSFVYTDDNRLANNEIRKEEIEVTDSLPVHLVQKYNIFNVKELVQTQQQTTLGGLSVSVKLRGKRNLPLATYLARGVAILTDTKPVTADSYLDSCDYSISPESNEFNLSASFVYIGAHKTREDIRLT